MSEPAPRNPGVRFPPPTLFAAGWLVGWALETRVLRLQWIAAAGVPAPLVIGGTALVVAGLLVISAGLLTFFRARTAIMPHRAASRLVTHGPYRFTRNPMYVGLSLLHAGLAVRANMVWPLLLLPLVLVVLVRLVIGREERYLASAFGEEYDAYRRRVRRWI